MDTKIAIIGAGNLGTSLVTGLVDSGNYSADNFIVPDDEVDDMLEKGSYFKP